MNDIEIHKKYIGAAIEAVSKYKKVLDLVNKGHYNRAAKEIRENFFVVTNCAYCRVNGIESVYDAMAGGCLFCDLNAPGTTYGCIESRSYDELKSAADNFTHSGGIERGYFVEPLIRALNKRIEFHLNNAIKHVEKIKSIKEEALWSEEELRKRVLLVRTDDL